MQVVRLVQEIIIVFGIEIILSPGLSAKRFAVADLLKVVQSAGNAFVPVGVEGIQIDTGPAVHAGIYFGTVDDLLSVCVYNTGRCGRVGVDEIGVGVDWIIGSFHVETVCLLSKLHSDQHIEVELKMDELDLTAAESKATYEEIKKYVLEHTGLKVSNLYIAQVKQKCGIIERVNYNLPKSENSRQPKCPPEKEKAIKEALEYFRMI